MMVKQYKVNEVYYSVQGEGVRAGTHNAFVRFSGCNMQCSIMPGARSPGGFDCDTEFVSGRRLSAEEIVEQCEESGESFSPDEYQRSVIFTGGEPGLQLDSDLVALFNSKGWYTAIETNGSIDISALGLDWITVSPKVAEHAVRQLEADEVRYVRGYGQAIPTPRCKAKNKLISPAFNGTSLDAKTLEWCEGLVRANHGWAISLQMHKVWGLR